MTRDELVQRLAEISHNTWMRQAARDKGFKAKDLAQVVTAHDLERAEDTVQELERLGVWPTADTLGTGATDEVVSP